MKKLLYAAYALLVTSVLSLSLASCEKDAGKLPNISFKTGIGYTSADATVPLNSSVLIGINASKSEGKDVITKFTITKSVNGGDATTVYTVDVTNGDTYSYEYTAATGSTAEQDKYTFTVVNKDGIVNSVSLTLTVQ
jgi:hypothetical protein